MLPGHSEDYTAVRCIHSQVPRKLNGHYKTLKPMLKNVFILPNVLYAAVTYCNVKRSEKTFVTEDSKKPVIHNPCCNEICQTL